MEKTKHYRMTRFSAEVIGEALKIFREFRVLREDEEPDLYLSVEVDGSDWKHDCENEFFADYRRSVNGAVIQDSKLNYGFRLQALDDSVQVSVKAPKRDNIEKVFAVFESKLDGSRIPEPSPKPKTKVEPVIFVGHGRDPQWRDLKDHLQDKHKLNVEAYEIGARAGHAVRDILEEMLTKSSFALLVMTGEDETSEGDFQARQNVVHEAGLFQGRLGFNRAIALLEEGTTEFSNIKGIEQIRFSKGNIKEVFGDVIATIVREFGG